MIAASDSGSPARPYSSIPVVPGLPVLGSVPNLMGDLRPFLTRAYQQHGPVFRVKAPGTEMIVIAGVEANKFAAKHDATHWRTWEIWHGLDGMFGVKQSILSLTGPMHREIRSTMRRPFGKAYLDAHLVTASAIAREDVAALNPGTQVGVTRWCQALVMEQLSHLATGSSSRRFLKDVIVFQKYSLMVAFNRAWPRAALLDPRFVNARENLFTLANALIERHRRVPPGPNRPADLIDDLLEAQRQTPELWSQADVRAGTLTAFSAGLDTAASTLAFTLYRLHRHPEVLPGLREEIDALFEQGDPTLEQLGRAPLLHGAVLEAMRLHPIAPALARHTTQDFEFGGYSIPAGRRLMIGTTVAHGLPEVYRDPERFDPARFGQGRAEHRRAGVYHPFGLGAHTCLGSGMAEGLLLLNVATLLRHVELELDPGFHLKVRHQPAPMPDESFRLRVVRRRSHPRPQA